MFVLIATIPPYVRHRYEIATTPEVNELRFNTVMPVGESKLEVLENLREACQGKKLWLDLKTRQLRITEFSYLPYAFVRLSHKIRVDLPATIYFKDHKATVVEIVDGDKLILEDRPHQIVGRGQPVNILDPSLEIEGFFTSDDLGFIEAAKQLGIHSYMLSFVEEERDILLMLEQDPEAEIIAKIESRKGLEFVKAIYPEYLGRVGLMAARDDLYINMGEDKLSMFEALATIITADPQAILASRILTSLESSGDVALQDLSDLKYMMALGYHNFMLSDGICFSKTAFRAVSQLIGQVINQ